MNTMCLVVTPDIQKLTENILQVYPEACKRAGFNADMCAEWIGAYNKAFNKSADNIPTSTALINYIEKQRNMDGKSFKYIPESIEYTYQGSKKTYTVIGTHIYNKDGKEVFAVDSKDRRRIFANLAVQEGRAVVVTHKNKKYVVNNRNQIISATTGDEMKWGEENGDRKAILASAQEKFENLIVMKGSPLSSSNNQLHPYEGDAFTEVKVDATNGVSKVALYYKYQLNALMAYLVPQTDGSVLNTKYWEHIQSVSKELPHAKTVEEAKDLFNSTLKAPNQNIQDVVNSFVSGKYEGTWTPKRKEDAWKQIEISNPIKTSPTSISEQLISHLKSVGINIFNRSQMEKYLKEHPNTLLQQALEEQWEMQDIKKKAIADGTFMKAPNGKPTNLNERQWLQVRTKNFINWFGDWINDPANASKVIDENGEPLVVYHHTNEVFNTFDASKQTYNEFYFTTSESEENIYYPNKTSKKYHIPVFLNIKELEYAEGNAPKVSLHKSEKIWTNIKNARNKVRKLVDEKAPAESIEKAKLEYKKLREQDLQGRAYITNASGKSVFYFEVPKKLWNEVGIKRKWSDSEDFYITFNPNQIKSATNNNGMFSTENDDIQMAIYRFVSKNSLPKGELSTLSSALMTKYGNKTAYGDVIQTANYEYTVNYKGAGEFDIIEYHPIDNDIKNIYNDREKEGFSESPDRWSAFDWITKREYNSDSFNVTDRETIGNNAGLDLQALQGESQQTQGNRSGQEYQGRNTRLVKTGADGTNSPRVIEVEDTLFFITPEGEIYGFVDKDGNMYLDETIIDASHPIHEYTHLWDRALEKTNPQLWKRGVNLMQEGVSGLWNEIANSENYGKLWQSKGIKGDRLVNLIASEVHARLVGENGAKLLDQIAKEKGNEGIIAKLKQWILEAWNELKATFSNWSQEEIDKLTLKDFNHMTVRDFADGINPNTASSPSNAAPIKSGEDTSSLAVGATGFSLSQEEIAHAQKIQEEVNKPKPERPNSAAYESALKTNESKMAQFKRVFSPQQIKDRGAMISNLFSKIIDENLFDEIDSLLDVIDSDAASEEDKKQAKLRLSALRDPVNGRQLEAESLGVPFIVNAIKEALNLYMEYAEGEQKQLYQNTLDYFEELFNTQASLDIEEREGIRIVGLKFTDQTTSEDENNAQDNGDEEVGHVVSGSDGWSFQVRFTDPFNSLSKKVRSMLYDVERPESEKDDLGQTRHYPMGQIYASLLSYLAKNMQNSDDFIQIDKSYEGKDNWGNDITDTTYPNGYPTFPVLEQMKNIYPWVSQIIQRLTDDYLNPEWNTNLRYPSTGGAMASQFYTNFRKAYIPYGKIQIGDGKFGITPLNYQMEERAQYDKLEANYNNRMILSPYSIYNSDGKVNKNHAEWLKQQLEIIVSEMDRKNYSEMPELMEYHAQHPEEEVLTEEDIKEYNDFINSAKMLLQSFGIDATQDSVAAYLTMDNGKTLRDMLSDLGWIATNILKVSDDKIDSYNYMLDTRDRYGSNLWAHFFDGRGMITDASYMQSFYDSASKKTKYSYSADNYLMKTFRGACMGTLEERRAYIDERFGKFEWFRNQKTGEWRNKWLEFWYNYTGEQKEIPYRNIDNVTDYSGDEIRIRQYSKWEPDDIWQVQSRSYDPENEAKTAFYLAPIFSDSPMSMTVKGPKMSMEELLYGYVDESGSHRQGALVQLVNQELWRIQYVQQRAKAIEEGRVKPIANFDGKRGLQFCFLPELNNYIFEDTGETFLQRMLRLKNEKATLQEIESTQITAIKDCIDRKMGEYVFENNKHYDVNNPLKAEQYYNMVYANAAIIQMTTVDLAFYKNDTDFQKRFKEVYAGGTQLNTNSKYGKKTENIILLSDDIITSPSYEKIASIIDNSKSLTEADKQEIKKSFTDINVADAQAIRSMHSFRSVLDMMGNWNDDMEEALNHFKDGTWSMEDYNVIYQTIKPFVYSVIERNDGFGGSILVPQQNKNSEICALMMYDLITNGLNNSPVYKALSKFMEDTVDGNGEHLIDMIQFESAGKVGNQGVVNISFNPNKVVAIIEHGVTAEGNEFEFSPAYIDGRYLDNTVENAEANYKAIKEDLDKELAEGKTTQKEYNKIMEYLRPTEDEIISMLEQAALVTNTDGTKGINTEVVHTIPFDNYYQQQPTPEHHIDAEATFGSQARNIAVADLPDNFEITLPGKGGKKTFKGKDALIDFYYELLNENLIEDFFGKSNKKGLKDIFESKDSLREAVEDIVRGNPKYGRDFAEALTLDKNGDFILNPNSPTIFPLMQELITSFFKNRITKQTINGASLIQAAGIGLDKDLRMKFDKEGKLLGAECYMPLTTKKFFEPLLETKIIDGKEVQILSPEKLKKAGLDKAVGYRIPTENKSSMMPLIIKDFTPLQNGSAIVLPAEITDIAGSDFDVDKMFIMLLSFYVQNYNMRRAREDYAKEDLIYKELLMRFNNSQLADDLLDVEPQSFKEWFEENKDNYLLDEPIIRKIEYDWSKSPKENGRKARNNMLIQMIFSILTSKEGSESLLNPQGFKDVKRAAKITRILTDNNLLNQLIHNTEEGVAPAVLPSPDKIIGEFLDLVREKYPDKYDAYKTAVMKLSTEQVQELYIKAVTAGNKGDAIKLLMDSSTKDLEKFISDYSAPESPVYPQTFAHSHARNMAGANQIGIYAIQGSMDAKYQRATTRLREEQQFTINGRKITNVDVSDEGKRLKNVGQMIGASADNGKDPNLSDMGSTNKTAPMIGYMLRVGLSHLEAALIINQQHMSASRYSSKNYKYWQGILGKNPLANPVGNVTTEMLIKGLISPFELTAEEDVAIAGLCYRILMQHEAQEYLTQISRADSPNGSIGNTYAKARIQQYKVDLFQAKMGQRDFPFVRIKEAISNDIVDTTASEEVIREQLKGQRMAFLHGMYALGINSFSPLVAPYFFGARKWFDDRIVKPILYNLNEKLSDDKKERIVNAIYTSYITYALSGSPLFGNEEGSSMKAKRDYYLESFPSDYQQILQDNEDIRELLSSILQVKNFGSRKRIILQDVGSLSKGQKQDVQRRLDSLAYSDNPVARNLAKDLLIYSYYDNGLQFTHDSFSHLFTTEYLTSFPAYTETLNTLDNELTPEQEENFIAQFLLTYPEASYKVDSVITGNNVQDDGNRIIVDLNDKKMRKFMINEVMSPNPQMEGINVYPYIQYNGEVYILDKNMFDQFPGTPLYHKINKYQTFPKLPLFSIQMSVTQMAQEFPVSEENKQSEELPSVDGVDAPVAHNEGSDDPSIASESMYDAFDSMDDFEAPDYDDLMAGEPQSPTDAYQAEGEGELRDPMCNA